MRVPLLIVAPSRTAHLRLPTRTTLRTPKVSASLARYAAVGGCGAHGTPQPENLRFNQVGERLPLEQLIPKASDERLRIGIPPGGTRLDVQSLHLREHQPLLERSGYEFGAVVRADERRSAPLFEQAL